MEICGKPSVAGIGVSLEPGRECEFPRGGFPIVRQVVGRPAEWFQSRPERGRPPDGPGFTSAGRLQGASFVSESMVFDQRTLEFLFAQGWRTRSSFITPGAKSPRL